MRIDWLGNKGFRELRTSSESLELVEEVAERALDRANQGTGRSRFGMRSTSGHTRAGAILFPENPAAMVRNARDNTLVKALFGG